MGKRKRDREPLSRKVKIAIASGVGIVVILVAIIIATIVILNQDSPAEQAAKKQEATQQAIQKQVATDTKLKDDAKKELDNNEDAQAEKIYQQEINAAPDVNRKIALYIDLANVYYDSGKKNEAFATAQKAADLSGDKFLAADWLARAYEHEGNYIESLKYYRIAGDSVASPQNEYGFNKQFYNEEADRIIKLSRGNQ